MLTLGAHYFWQYMIFNVLRFHGFQAFPLLLPVALPVFTPISTFHELGHRWRIKWYTSGFL